MERWERAELYANAYVLYTCPYCGFAMTISKEIEGERMRWYKYCPNCGKVLRGEMK